MRIKRYIYKYFYPYVPVVLGAIVLKSVLSHALLRTEESKPVPILPPKKKIEKKIVPRSKISLKGLMKECREGNRRSCRDFRMRIPIIGESKEERSKRFKLHGGE